MSVILTIIALALLSYGQALYHPNILIISQAQRDYARHFNTRQQKPDLFHQTRRIIVSPRVPLINSRAQVNRLKTPLPNLKNITEKHFSIPVLPLQKLNAQLARNNWKPIINSRNVLNAKRNRVPISSKAKLPIPTHIKTNLVPPKNNRSLGYKMFERDKLFKRWGPEFVIIENAGTKKSRPPLGAKTKVLQFNPGTPDRIPPYSFSYIKNTIPLKTPPKILKKDNNSNAPSKGVPGVFPVTNNIIKFHEGPSKTNILLQNSLKARKSKLILSRDSLLKYTPIKQYLSNEEAKSKKTNTFQFNENIDLNERLLHKSNDPNGRDLRAVTHDIISLQEGNRVVDKVTKPLQNSKVYDQNPIANNLSNKSDALKTERLQHIFPQDYVSGLLKDRIIDTSFQERNGKRNNTLNSVLLQDNFDNINTENNLFRSNKGHNDAFTKEQLQRVDDYIDSRVHPWKHTENVNPSKRFKNESIDEDNLQKTKKDGFEESYHAREDDNANANTKKTSSFYAALERSLKESTGKKLSSTDEQLISKMRSLSYRLSPSSPSEDHLAWIEPSKKQQGQQLDAEEKGLIDSSPLGSLLENYIGGENEEVAVPKENSLSFFGNREKSSLLNDQPHIEGSDTKAYMKTLPSSEVEAKLVEDPPNNDNSMVAHIEKDYSESNSKQKPLNHANTNNKEKLNQYGMLDNLKKNDIDSCKSEECQNDLMKKARRIVSAYLDRVSVKHPNHVIKMYSTGCRATFECDGADSLIQFNGAKIGGKTKGMNIVIISYPEFEFRYAKTYNTGEDPNESEKMVKFLSEVRDSSIILLVSNGDATSDMTDEAWNALGSISNKPSFTKKTGSSLVMVGFKGDTVHPWVQVNQKEGKSGILTVIGTDGNYISVGGFGDDMYKVFSAEYSDEAYTGETRDRKKYGKSNEGSKSGIEIIPKVIKNIPFVSKSKDLKEEKETKNLESKRKDSLSQGDNQNRWQKDEAVSSYHKASKESRFDKISFRKEVSHDHPKPLLESEAENEPVNPFLQDEKNSDYELTKSLKPPPSSLHFIPKDNEEDKLLKSAQLQSFTSGDTYDHKLPIELSSNKQFLPGDTYFDDFNTPPHKTHLTPSMRNTHEQMHSGRSQFGPETLTSEGASSLSKPKPTSLGLSPVVEPLPAEKPIPHGSPEPLTSDGKPPSNSVEEVKPDVPVVVPVFQKLMEAPLAEAKPDKSIDEEKPDLPPNEGKPDLPLNEGKPDRPMLNDKPDTEGKREPSIMEAKPETDAKPDTTTTQSDEMTEGKQESVISDSLPPVAEPLPPTGYPKSNPNSNLMSTNRMPQSNRSIEQKEELPQMEAKPSRLEAKLDVPQEAKQSPEIEGKMGNPFQQEAKPDRTVEGKIDFPFESDGKAPGVELMPKNDKDQSPIEGKVGAPMSEEAKNEPNLDQIEAKVESTPQNNESPTNLETNPSLSIIESKTKQLTIEGLPFDVPVHNSKDENGNVLQTKVNECVSPEIVVILKDGTKSSACHHGAAKNDIISSKVKTNSVNFNTKLLKSQNGEGHARSKEFSTEGDGEAFVDSKLDGESLSKELSEKFGDSNIQLNNLPVFTKHRDTCCSSSQEHHCEKFCPADSHSEAQGYFGNMYSGPPSMSNRHYYNPPLMGHHSSFGPSTSLAHVSLMGSKPQLPSMAESEHVFGKFPYSSSGEHIDSLKRPSYHGHDYHSNHNLDCCHTDPCCNMHERYEHHMPSSHEECCPQCCKNFPVHDVAYPVTIDVSTPSKPPEESKEPPEEAKEPPEEGKELPEEAKEMPPVEAKEPPPTEAKEIPPVEGEKEEDEIGSFGSLGSLKLGKPDEKLSYTKKKAPSPNRKVKNKETIVEVPIIIPIFDNSKDKDHSKDKHKSQRNKTNSQTSKEITDLSKFRLAAELIKQKMKTYPPKGGCNCVCVPTEPSKLPELSNSQEPSEPSEQSAPSEPSEPTNPSQPSEPLNPTEQSKQSGPIEPLEHSKPLEQTEPAELAKPSKLPKLSEPAEPLEPPVPSEPLGPSQPSEPLEPPALSEPLEPLAISEPLRPPAPSEPLKPPATPEPLEPSQSEKTLRPQAPSEPIKTPLGQIQSTPSQLSASKLFGTTNSISPLETTKPLPNKTSNPSNSCCSGDTKPSVNQSMYIIENKTKELILEKATNNLHPGKNKCNSYKFVKIIKHGKSCQCDCDTISNKDGIMNSIESTNIHDLIALTGKDELSSSQKIKPKGENDGHERLSQDFRGNEKFKNIRNHYEQKAIPEVGKPFKGTPATESKLFPSSEGKGFPLTEGKTEGKNMPLIESKVLAPIEAKEPLTEAKEPSTEAKELPTEAKEPPTEAKEPPTEAKEVPTEAKGPLTEGKGFLSESKNFSPIEGKERPKYGQHYAPIEGKETPTEGKEVPTEAKEPLTEGKGFLTESKEFSPIEGKERPKYGQHYAPIEGKESPTEGKTDFPIQAKISSTESKGIEASKHAPIKVKYNPPKGSKYVPQQEGKGSPGSESKGFPPTEAKADPGIDTLYTKKKPKQSTFHGNFHDGNNVIEEANARHELLSNDNLLRGKNTLDDYKQSKVSDNMSPEFQAKLKEMLAEELNRKLKDLTITARDESIKYEDISKQESTNSKEITCRDDSVRKCMKECPTNECIQKCKTSCLKQDNVLNSSSSLVHHEEKLPVHLQRNKTSTEHFVHNTDINNNENVDNSLHKLNPSLIHQNNRPEEKHIFSSLKDSNGVSGVHNQANDDDISKESEHLMDEGEQIHFDHSEYITEHNGKGLAKQDLTTKKGNDITPTEQVEEDLNSRESIQTCKKSKVLKYGKKKKKTKKGCIEQPAINLKVHMKVEPSLDTANSLPEVDLESKKQDQSSYLTEHENDLPYSDTAYKDEAANLPFDETAYTDATASNLYNSASMEGTTDRFVQKAVNDAFDTASDLISDGDAADFSTGIRKKKNTIKSIHTNGVKKPKLSAASKKKTSVKKGKKLKTKNIDDALKKSSFKWK